MKHIATILITIFAVLSFDANAQGGLVYTPFIPNQSSSSSSIGSGSSYRPRSNYVRPSVQRQTIRTTAYYADYEGNYHKVPICVEYAVYSNGASTLNVTQKWQSSALGGNWCSLLSPATVQNCTPLTANGNTAELERSFMCKAMVGTNWYYFDL